MRAVRKVPFGLKKFRGFVSEQRRKVLACNGFIIGTHKETVIGIIDLLSIYVEFPCINVRYHRIYGRSSNKTGCRPSAARDSSTVRDTALPAHLMNV
jgi:hypothetical protein